MTRHPSSAVPLAWLYAGLIVYASLYPFTGWRVAAGNPFAFLVMPWSRWWSGFDLVSNLLGYLPLGLLVFGARVRGGASVAAGVWSALAAGTLLSLTMELVQNGLPYRVPSNIDLVLNIAGSGAGAAVGALVHWLGGLERWQSLRERWFIGRSAGGLALLVLWPLGLLFPAPVPFGLGQVFDRVHEVVDAAVEGSAVAGWFASLPAVAPADRRQPVAGRRSVDRRARPVGAVPGGVCDRAPGLAASRAGGRRGGAGVRGDDAVDGDELRAGPCARLAHAERADRHRHRRGVRRAARAVAATRRGRPRPGRADRRGAAGRACACRPLFRAEPAGLGTGALHPLPRVPRNGWAGCGRTWRWSTCSCAWRRATNDAPGRGVPPPPPAGATGRLGRPCADRSDT